MEKTRRSCFRADELMLLVGFILVYLVMVAQFQSLRSPFIVIFTIPLAFTGGMLALLICGQDVSVVSMMGFVMLMGVVVNNAIVLVDCINRFRLEGMDMESAVIEAGAVRMRPDSDDSDHNNSGTSASGYRSGYRRGNDAAGSHRLHRRSALCDFDYAGRDPDHVPGLRQEAHGKDRGGRAGSRECVRIVKEYSLTSNDKCVTL